MYVTNTGDPVAVVVALNAKRRNLNKGQVAIAAAESVPISGQSHRKAAAAFGVSSTYLDQAAALLQEAPEAAEAVKQRRVSLGDAYEAHPFGAAGR